MRGMDCPRLPSQEGCLSHDSAVLDYQTVMPSQVRRLVSPYNPSYTPTENIVPAGLRLPNRMTRSTTPGPGAVCLGTSGGDGAHRRSHEPTAEQPEVEAELGLGRGHVTYMAGFYGGHGWAGSSEPDQAGR